MLGNIDTKVQRKISWIKDFMSQDFKKKLSQRSRFGPLPWDFYTFVSIFAKKLRRLNFFLKIPYAKYKFKSKIAENKTFFSKQHMQLVQKLWDLFNLGGR